MPHITFRSVFLAKKDNRTVFFWHVVLFQTFNLFGSLLCLSHWGCKKKSLWWFVDRKRKVRRWTMDKWGVFHKLLNLLYVMIKTSVSCGGDGQGSSPQALCTMGKDRKSRSCGVMVWCCWLLLAMFVSCLQDSTISAFLPADWMVSLWNRLFSVS